MSAAAISISYCADHTKGWGPPVEAMRHCMMLQQTVEYLLAEVPHWEMVVCASAWPGLVNIEAMQRQVYYQLIRRGVHFSTIPDNPGHQAGAGWAIRQGVEYAREAFKAEYLIHTAEDVVPRCGEMEQMVRRMAREHTDYVGERWGVEKDELNAQFFGCRLSVWASIFDGAAVTGHGHTERYCAHLMTGRPISEIDRVYYHSHDPEEHRRFLQEAWQK